MGMFDKDKEIGLLLTRPFVQGEQFILWSAEVTREDFPTKFGPSPQATLRVSKLSLPREQMEVTTLASAIVAKVREATPDDFPAVVFWTTAQARSGGDAVVLQFVKPYGGQQEAGTGPETAPQQGDLNEHGEPMRF